MNEKQRFDDFGRPVTESPELSESEKWERLGQLAKREILENSSLNVILSTAKECGLQVEDLETTYQDEQRKEREQIETYRAKNIGTDTRDIFANEKKLRDEIYSEVSKRALEIIMKNN